MGRGASHWIRFLRAWSSLALKSELDFCSPEDLCCTVQTTPVVDVTRAFLCLQNRDAAVQGGPGPSLAGCKFRMGREGKVRFVAEECAAPPLVWLTWLGKARPSKFLMETLSGNLKPLCQFIISTALWLRKKFRVQNYSAKVGSLFWLLWFLKKGMNFLTANREEVTCPPLHVSFSIFSLNLNQDIFLKKHNYWTMCNLVNFFF